MMIAVTIGQLITQAAQVDQALAAAAAESARHAAERPQTPAAAP